MLLCLLWGYNPPQQKNITTKQQIHAFASMFLFLVVDPITESKAPLKAKAVAKTNIH